MTLAQFAEVWLIDFEFRADPGERPVIRCMCGYELHSGRSFRIWADQLGGQPPFKSSQDVLVVTFYGSAEAGCFLQLGWVFPQKHLDLFTEWRWLRNGLIHQGGLQAALNFFREPIVVDKSEMRDLAMDNRPSSDYSPEERENLMNYCLGDCLALKRLLPHVLPHIQLEYALFRGLYMSCVAQMEYRGIPIDMPAWENIAANSDSIKRQMVEELDQWDVYEGTTFKLDKFARLLKSRGILWPTTATGRLKTDSNTFRDYTKGSDLSDLFYLREFISHLKLAKLHVGADGRNRCLLSPFQSRTARNQPSNVKCIFGPSVWIRHLIKPVKGTGIAYIDWGQQEFAIAAKLSKDANMIEAYESGDPYLSFGKLAGAIPPGGTKEDYPNERRLYKQTVLGLQYGMACESLASRLNKPVAQANTLILQHHEVFRDFWVWADRTVNRALADGCLNAPFGWKLTVPNDPNMRSLQNWQVQTTGSEMLRIAVVLAIGSGVKVVTTVHDALLIEFDLLDEKWAIAKAQECMRRAGEILLGGMQLRTDVDIVRYPNRYRVDRGRDMWLKLCEKLSIED
ncbi:MAG: DNA polymerase [Desulfobulbaceae bacterium]|jgi:DNA polymerase-1|nr:DNA polymerase [Desulfobulbaceae bacterium]